MFVVQIRATDQLKDLLCCFSKMLQFATCNDDDDDDDSNNSKK